jgi:hypothetical protein
MEIFKDNYTEVFIERLIDSNNQLNSAIILLREENNGVIFPVALDNTFFEYLKNISNDKNHEENFLCDLVYKLDKPKSIFIKLKNGKLSSFYLNISNKKINLNLIELLSFAVRYPISIYIENKILYPSIKEDYFIKADSTFERKVDLYALDRNSLDNLTH